MSPTIFLSIVICAVVALVPRTVFGSQPGQHEADSVSNPYQPAGERLTAGQLVELVLEANPGLAAVRAAAEAAAYRVDSAGSLDDPRFSYGIAPLTVGAGRLNQRFEISQAFPWPGTLDARERAARFEAEAAHQDIAMARLQVFARAKSALAEWWFVNRALEIHHDTLALLDRLVDIAEIHYAAGRVPKQDVLHAEVERARLDEHLFELQRLKTGVQARINALIDRDPAAALPPAADPEDLEQLPELSSLQAVALERHPELSRLDAQHAASRSRVTLAEKAFYPQFQVGAGYNSLWEDPDQRPIVAVSLSLPLDRNKRRSDLHGREAEMARAEWRLADRRATLLADIAQARADVVATLDSIRLYRDQLLPLASEHLETAIADYQSGKGAFLNVITAEQGKLDADFALARARADHSRAQAELELWAAGSLDGPPLAPTGERP